MTYTSVVNLLSALIFLATSTLTPHQQTISQQPKSQTAKAEHELVFTVDPAQSTVHWSLESSVHTVHGTFRVKHGIISIDPATGKASGEIVVDATTGESGNDSRDHKMHKEVLESSRYSEVIFRPDHIDGTLASRGNSDLKLHGIFTLHGDDHEFSAAAQTEINETRWKGSSTFAVPFIEWKLKNPSNFLLKVKPIVNVQLELAGSIQRP
jgi:hypothetical protein